MTGRPDPDALLAQQLRAAGHRAVVGDQDQGRPVGTRQFEQQVHHLLAGGAERVAVEVACALDRTRFTPLVVVTRGTGPLEPLLREAGVETLILGRAGKLFSPRKLARAVRAVRSCDLLHVHKLEGSAWGCLIGRLARRPVVAHEHSFYGEPNRVRRLLYRFWIGRSAGDSNSIVNGNAPSPTVGCSRTPNTCCTRTDTVGVARP